MPWHPSTVEEAANRAHAKPEGQLRRAASARDSLEDESRAAQADDLVARIRSRVKTASDHAAKACNEPFKTDEWRTHKVFLAEDGAVSIAKLLTELCDLCTQVPLF